MHDDNDTLQSRLFAKFDLNMTTQVAIRRGLVVTRWTNDSAESYIRASASPKTTFKCTNITLRHN